MANKRSYKVLSTTTLTPVAGYDSITEFNHVSLINLTDGDVDIYFGQTDVPDIIVPTTYNVAFDLFIAKGQAYIKNATGSGGYVYLHVWRFAII